MPHHYVKKILQARVHDVARETPIEPAHNLSRRLRNRVLFKREDLQPVFSFKIRGAYNKIVQLTEAEKQQGVVAASAGNHAQGVALACAKLGIKATIVMPRTTPDIKVASVRHRGAKVVLHGDNFNAAADYAATLVEQQGYTYIPPYDDEEVIAGQGTVAMEIVWQHSDPLHAVFVPVGGGGLIAGVAAYLKYVRPDIKVIGVEPEDAACLKAALDKGRRVTLKEVGMFADGVAVKQVGKLPFDICKTCVDDVVTVTTDEMCAAIKDVFEDTRSIAEPAGALSVAGMKKYVQSHGLEGENLLAILSGANMNFDRLRYISERTEIGEQREAILAVTIPEQAGSFRRFCKILSKHNITEFNYRYANEVQAEVFVGIQVAQGGADRAEVIAKLQQAGYSTEDLTDNDMAKNHLRHMVGGHAASVDNEHIFRVQFPERPGALLDFLNGLGDKFNISLFHYRNHGAAYGRVLVGLQVGKGEKTALRTLLNAIGYRYWEETDNPAYQRFLGAYNLSR